MIRYFPKNCLHLIIVITLPIVQVSAQVVLNKQHQINLSYKNLFPESIAKDTATGNIFLSSIAQRKIIIRKPNGEAEDFISRGELGFDLGLGLKIDQKNRKIWALSSSKNSKMASLFVFDIDNNRKFLKFDFVSDKVIFFNDLCFDHKSNVYITDSYNQDIWKLNTVTGEKSIYFQNPIIKNPNGITFDIQQNALFIAGDLTGIVKLSVIDKHFTILTMPGKNASSGLDGLYYKDHSIIGIYNGSEKMDQHRVIRYFLNSRNDTVLYIERLKSTNLMVPTTGAIINNDFYFLSHTYLTTYINNQTIDIMEFGIDSLNLSAYEFSPRQLRRVKIVQDLIEAFNRGDWDKVFSYYHKNAVYIDQEQNKEKNPLNAKQVREKYEKFRADYPNLGDVINDIEFEGDKAIVNVTISGTHALTKEVLNSKATLMLFFDNNDYIIKEVTVFE